MTPFIIAALMLGTATAAPPAPVEHSVRVDHPAGSVDARYDGNVAISYRQVGAAGAGGRASSLRCTWSADMMVQRQATAAGGSTMSRSFVREGVLTGSRPGWCDTHRSAIDREVAGRMDDLHGHVRAMAAEDHELLRGEIDRWHGSVRAG